MAATPAPRNWAVFARRAFALTAAGAVALVALAVPASAHTPKWSAGCDEAKGETAAAAWVKFELKFYDDSRNPNKVNKFVLKDGDTVLASSNDFGSAVKETKIDLDPTVEHKLTFKVTSHNGYGQVDESKTVKACVKTPPSSSTATQPPSEEQPPAEEEQPPAEETTTTTTTVAVGVNANLAETGASIALPIGIGALLLIGGAGLLFVLRRRDKA
ncbi:MAG TPA: LPXTG cell wall anchor domain-containing protein [Actinophytocola sp.]|uniref:LPXTG cell wall anchor domain-containing protein n=1 Tax=Actinophytocola sp. TaxID=1872138 RepID=UPI002DB92DC3|nr:LPXTG cell wall anchor domain-containing protein [Actinophytocola sp.]HEU5470508.1 LPXTG cell wall anchor domain-containing protein [Actinophytocola sp.]